MDSLLDLLKQRNRIDSKKVNRTEWQLEAVEAIRRLSDGSRHSGSIFKCYRDNIQKARTALADSIELNKPFSLYFLKVYNELVKRVKNQQKVNKKL